jgi:putative SOS response-associated peptidase YedK
MKDGRPFTFAALWDNWKDPDSGEWLRVARLSRGEPSELVAQIHPRVPVILPEEHHAAWPVLIRKVGEASRFAFFRTDHTETVRLPHFT